MAGRHFAFFEQLAVEADQAHVTALVADVDSGYAADFAGLLHALALGFQLLGEWYFLFAGCRPGFGWLPGVLFAGCLPGFALLLSGVLLVGVLPLVILLHGWPPPFFRKKIP